MPHDDTAIKLATLDDLPAIRQLWRGYVEEADPRYPVDVIGSIDTFTRQLAVALAQQPPTVTAFVAYGPHLVPRGFLLYEVQSRVFGEPARYGFIHFIFVIPSARHQGTGNLLAALAGEHMVANGLSHCEVTYVPDDTQWLDLGFTPFEVRAYVPCTQALGLMRDRQRSAAAKRGNGLDHSVLEQEHPAAPDASTLEAEKET